MWEKTAFYPHAAVCLGRNRLRPKQSTLGRRCCGDSIHSIASASFVSVQYRRRFRAAATYLHENFSMCTAAVESTVSGSKSIDSTFGEAGMLFDSANEWANYTRHNLIATGSIMGNSPFVALPPLLQFWPLWRALHWGRRKENGERGSMCKCLAESSNLGILNHNSSIWSDSFTPQKGPMTQNHDSLGIRIAPALSMWTTKEHVQPTWEVPDSI